jgi:hypothetical protein
MFDLLTDGMRDVGREDKLTMEDFKTVMDMS